MGYFQDGTVRLNMKQVFEIHYSLKFMMGGTPIVVGTTGYSGTLETTVTYQFWLFQYQICANKNTISIIPWI